MNTGSVYDEVYSCECLATPLPCVFAQTQ